MKKANISQVKSKLSAYLKDVQRGETVLIFDRNHPVARLEAVDWGGLSDEDRIRELVRLGVAKAPKKKLDVEAFLALPRPKLPPAVSLVDMIIQEREESL